MQLLRRVAGDPLNRLASGRRSCAREFPPAGAPLPPGNLRYARIVGTPGPALTLTWDASQSPGVRSYNIYQQRTYGTDRRPCDLSVTFDTPYVKIATVQASEPLQIAVEPLPGYAGVNEHPWYTVTAVDEGGRESGWARNGALTNWGPWGNATVERPDVETIKVTLPADVAWIQARRSFVVQRDATLRFRVKTTSTTPTTLRLNVAGLGEVDILITGGEQGRPVIGSAGTINDGQWHEVSIPLRRALDNLARERGVTPAQARTTWNEDWLVVECRFGRWISGGPAGEVFWFQELQIR